MRGINDGRCDGREHERVARSRTAGVVEYATWRLDLPILIHISNSALLRPKSLEGRVTAKSLGTSLRCTAEK